MEKNPLSAKTAPGDPPQHRSTASTIGASEALSVAFWVTRWAAEGCIKRLDTAANSVSTDSKSPR